MGVRRRSRAVRDASRRRADDRAAPSIPRRGCARKARTERRGSSHGEAELGGRGSGGPAAAGFCTLPRRGKLRFLQFSTSCSQLLKLAGLCCISSVASPWDFSSLLKSSKLFRRMSPIAFFSSPGPLRNASFPLGFSAGSPAGSPPAGCEDSSPRRFHITVAISYPRHPTTSKISANLGRSITVYPKLIQIGRFLRNLKRMSTSAEIPGICD